MLLLRWESNRTFTACRAGGLTTLDYKGAYLSSLTTTYYCAATVLPPTTQRAVVLGCEGNRCWRRPCYSYVRRSNPDDAADPEHSGHRAVAEGCCVRACVLPVGGHQCR
ncbi:hypothetical protein Zmor_017932 [Zophobas morio]|uniref:Uncharacterized protein n=1 Tax=Zophobas morio TaxID=2755281 RepID=A0AA38I614_9CUCU|nr:hypothetical protein Zmor_017932 [Zophobas morio]